MRRRVGAGSRWAGRAALVLAIAQAVMGARVAARLAGTARVIRVARRDEPAAERIGVIVPVLNERDRLAPCLVGLLAQPDEFAEIVVVDGGSTDGTRELVARFAARDSRLRWLDATPVPPGINGKAHGLQAGLGALGAGHEWILTIDADVRPGPDLARSLLSHAAATGLVAFSVATGQRLSGPGEGIVHPAMLATLVYRYGIPGQAVTRVRQVQANGQCMLVRADALRDAGGFAAVRDSVCEDVTLARGLVLAGHRVGFFESEGLVSVEMYGGWREAWHGWTRSLPMHDRHAGTGTIIGLAEVVLAQAGPIPVLATLLTRSGGRGGWGSLLGRLNLALLTMRLGTLAGMARAYENRPVTYWLSPLADLPVALALARSAARRHHSWRGRPITRGGQGAIPAPAAPDLESGVSR